ncbi:MAG: ketol-acid reductoisomerase [Gammaproteobacteria bacterium]
MKILYESDTLPALILERRIAVIGFGAQGRAQALNLKDSGASVVVGLRDGSDSAAAVRKNGLEQRGLAAAIGESDVIVVLVPDTEQQALYEGIIRAHAQQGALLVFAHGFNLHYQRIRPRKDLDVVLVAPLGIGEQVREVFCKGGGVPALFAIFQNSTGKARELGLSYATALGHGKAGIIESSVAEETESDLFAEQAVLCGGLTHLIETAFETLVETGYAPEVAYFCCLHEVKLIADLIQSRGIVGMRDSISHVAEFGDYISGPRVIGDASRNEMRKILKEIQSGEFARQIDASSDEFKKVIADGRQKARAHLLEKTGAVLRAKMTWLEK